MSVAVVTGATGETGTAVCAELLAAGHTVVAVGSDEGRLADVAASARLVCDLTDAAAAGALAGRVREVAGRADALVHLVGGWRSGHSADDWDWLEPRLLTSLRLTTLSLMDDLVASPKGRLIAIGSTSAEKPTWGGANYATLKAASDAWLAAIASGWGKAGTGAVVTLLVQSIGEGGTPVHRIATEIADVISSNADELNGARIRI